MKKSQKKTSKGKRIAHIGMGAVMALPTLVAVAPVAVQAADSIPPTTKQGEFTVTPSGDDSIAIGESSMGVTTPTGEVAFWGYQGSGGLFGDTSNVYGNYLTPKLNKVVDNADKLYMTYSSTFIVKKDGTVWGAGGGGNYSLPARSNSFTQLMSLADEFIVKMDTTFNGVAALNSKGEVFYWGGQAVEGNGVTSTPRKIQGLSGVKDIEVTENYLMVILADNSVGYYTKTLDTGTTKSYSYENSTMKKFGGLTAIKAIDVNEGSLEGLALKADGNVLSFSLATLKATSISSLLTDIVAVSRGNSFNLALKSNGDVYAWGDNDYGQLGIGSISSKKTTPVKISALSNITNIKASANLALAVDKDGVVYTWGKDDYGSPLGRDGSNFTPYAVTKAKPQEAEKPVEKRVSIQDMTAKTSYLSRSTNTIKTTIGGKLTGTIPGETLDIKHKVNGVESSQYNFINSVGVENNLYLSTYIPAEVGEHSVTVQIKGNDGTVIGEQTVKVTVTPEELARISSYDTEVPTRELGNVLVSTDNKHIVSGDGGAMGVVTADGGVAFWGAQGLGNFGLGTTLTANGYPKITTGVKDVDKIFMASTTTFLIKKDSSVWVAGNPWDKTFSASEPYLEFKEVKELSNIGIDKIATSRYGQAALSKEGEVYYWGGREGVDVGALATPRKVPGVAGVKDVVVDENMIALLFDNGTVGIVKKTLDNGSTISNSYANSPVTMLDGLTNIKSLGEGSFAESFFGVKEDGTVVEYNYYKSVLKTIPNLTDIVSISTGFNFSTALDSKGNVYAWGSNDSGQMGKGYLSYDSQNDYQTEPLKIDKLSNIVSISSRYLSAVAIDKDGVAYTWGKQELGYSLGRDGAQSVPYPVTKYVPVEPEVVVPKELEIESAVAGEVKFDDWDDIFETDVTGILKGTVVNDYVDVRHSVDGVESAWYSSFKVLDGDTPYSIIPKLPKEVGTHTVEIWATGKNSLKSEKISVDVTITQDDIDKANNIRPEMKSVVQDGDSLEVDGGYLVNIKGAVKDEEGDTLTFKYKTLGEEYTIDKTMTATGKFENFNHELVLPYNADTDADSRYIVFWTVDSKGVESIKTVIDITEAVPKKGNTAPVVKDFSVNTLYGGSSGVVIPLTLGINDEDEGDTVTAYFSVNGVEHVWEEDINTQNMFPVLGYNYDIGKQLGTYDIEMWAVDSNGAESERVKRTYKVTAETLIDLGAWAAPILGLENGPVVEYDGGYVMPVLGYVTDSIEDEDLEVKYLINGVEKTLVTGLVSTGYTQDFAGLVNLPDPSALEESLDRFGFGKNPPTVDITFWAEDEVGLKSEEIKVTATYPVKTPPVEPEVPVVPTEPEKPDEPEKPTEPVIPVEPEKPAEPEKPSEPVIPTEPEVPVVPTEPVIPVEPEKPTEPVIPVEPEKPTEPVIPVEPEKPTEPVIPVEPEKPTEPVKPAEPEVKPSEPEVNPIPNPSTGDVISPPHSDTISGDLAQELGYVLLADKTKTNDIVIELLRDSLQDSSKINMNVHIKPDKDIIEPTLYMYYTHKSGASKDKFKIDDLDVFETIPLKTIKAGGGIDVKVSSSLKKGKDYKVSAVVVDKDGKVHSKNELDANKLKEYMVLKKVNQDVESKGLLSKLTSAIKGVFSGK